MKSLLKIGVLLVAILLAISAQAEWHINVLWSRAGYADSAGYGDNVFSLGDQNNDGFADWAVFGYGRDAGHLGASVLELFHGGNPPSTQPYMTFRADPTVAMRMSLGAAAGDVNGDGYEDWFTYVRYLDNVMIFTAQIYYGGPAADTLPDAVMHLRVSALGESIHRMGDFNGDNFDDLYRYDQGNDIGYILYGSANVDTIPDWRLISPSDQPWLAQFSGFGYINHDRFADFIPVNNNPGLKVFWGGTNPDTLPQMVAQGIGSGYQSVVQDLNGDDADEIVLSDSRQMRVFWGGETISPTPNAVLSFPVNCTPYTVEGLGDVNGDGYNDLGAITYLCNDSWYGTFALYLGNQTLNTQPVLTLNGGALGLSAMWSVCGLGDINGDGIHDFALGGVDVNNLGDRGSCIVLSGDTSVRVDAADPFILHPSSFSLSCYPNPFNGQATVTIAAPLSAQKVELTLMNLLGQVVQRAEVPCLGGQALYRIGDSAGSALSSGLYFLRAQTTNLQTCLKLMVLK